MKLTNHPGVLLPLVLILLQACHTGKATSSYQNNGTVPVFQTDMLVQASAGTGTYRNDISIRAVRHFTETYPDVQDERWYIIKDGFMAKFRRDSTHIRIDYNRNGKWLYTIRYLFEKQLPREVRRLIRSNWLDHQISSAEEVQVDKQFIYLVHIHEGNDWKIIRVIDGEMTEVFPPNKAD